MKLEVKMRKEARLIRRMSGRWKEIKFNRKRITVFSEGKYVGWLRKCDYLNLCKVTDQVRTRVDGKFRVKFNTIIFQKTVKMHYPTLSDPAVRRTIKVTTYTKTQREFVAEEYKKHLIPVNVEGHKTSTDLLEDFKMAEMSVTTHKPSP